LLGSDFFEVPIKSFFFRLPSNEDETQILTQDCGTSGIQVLENELEEQLGGIMNA
jgi:hypothetical protein